MKRGKSKDACKVNNAKRPKRSVTLLAKKTDTEIFSQWKGFLDNESFTDLRIICKDEYRGEGISVHKAVLASVSSLMASILLDGRDETTLMMPDVEKEDLLNLVKILYGENTASKEPSNGLLHMLGIKSLPELQIQSSNSLTTCIQIDCFGDEANDESSSESESESEKEDAPACSVGGLPDADDSEPGEDPSASPPKESSNNAEVRIGLDKLSAQLVAQLKTSPTLSRRSRPRERWVQNRSQASSRNSSRYMTRSRSKMRASSIVSSSRSSSSSSSSSASSTCSSRSSSSSSAMSGVVNSRASSGARVWKPDGTQGQVPPPLPARTTTSLIEKDPDDQSHISEKTSLNLALTETDIEDDIDIEENFTSAQTIIDDHDIDEVFANPAKPVQVMDANPKTKQNDDIFLNTPAHVPPTPKWCPDIGVCPPGRCKSTTNKKEPTMTSLNPTTSLLTTKTNELMMMQPTPFQTPPPSVSHSSYTATPEHPPFISESNSSNDEMTSFSPILPPDLFRDESTSPSERSLVIDEDPPRPKTNYLTLPPPANPSKDEDAWSEDEGNRSDWSEATWSEDEDKPDKKLKKQRFSSVFQRTRMSMTPRSQEISRLLDDLYSITSK